MENVQEWLPTLVTSLVLGYLTFRATRAGQKDEVKIQQQANRLAETEHQRAEAQRLLEGQRSLTEQAQANADRYRRDALEVEDRLRVIRKERDQLEDKLEELQNRYCRELSAFGDKLYELEEKPNELGPGE
jgi:chromosome segregation ATPase